MRFWDSSGLVPLCVAQPFTARARAWYDRDAELIVWWGSAVEWGSAIARLHREGGLTSGGESAAHRILAILRASWFEVQPGDAIREQAFRLLRLHPLRAADALQLAAALEWAGSPPPRGSEFMSFDERLRTAARQEGFATPAA